MTVWDVWERHFGALPPVGHLLRQAIPHRWMRIHILPGSHRYAAGDLEYVELLSRHNQIAAEILGSDAEAILFIHAWGTGDAFRASFIDSGKAKEVGLSEDRLFTRGFSSEGESLVVGGRRIQWSERAWDTLPGDGAGWALNSGVLMNPESGEVFGPYDGGADLFLKALERVAELRQRWVSWVSNHPSGL